MAATVSRSLRRGSTTRLNRNPAAAWRHLDVVLIGAVVAIGLLGTLMVWSATRGPSSPYQTGFFTKQLAFVVIGMVLLAVVSLVDYRVFRDFALILYGAACATLLVVVSPLGSSSKGTQGWFQIGSFQLQPSEFAKLGLIFLLSAAASQFHGEIDLRRLAALLAIGAAPLALIMLQPDLGTGLVLVAILAGIMLVAGVPGRYLVGLFVVGAIGVVGVFHLHVLKEYQQARLTSFTAQDVSAKDNPELARAKYNVDQSKITIGAGGWGGEGLFNGSQTRLGNVPEQHTDFIFTAVGEQLGFMGGATLLSLFAIVAWRIWRTAQLARDPFGSLVCVGVLCLLMFQIFENVGMTMGIMPVTGIPLPFVSYGGSSTLAEFVAIGLVLNIHSRRFS
ncbi:MAG: rod shape-determining protein RodA [Acidimicrobiales bacterium]